jgi:hydrogenase nickel incorporation protein HypB
MCKDCGCSTTGNAITVDGVRHGAHTQHPLQVNLATHLHAANLQSADHNRAHFNEHGTLAVNLMSAPGSGKTALLEATIERYRNERRIAVIEGDLETENDANRIRRRGVPAIQITTGNACHLDAQMVHAAMHRLDLSAHDLIFVENVGNLVCPASFDVGAHVNVALLSMAEGDDKPAKYPVMFRSADLVLITKCDLAAVFDDFSIERATRYVREVGCAAPVLPVSGKTGEGLPAWWAWLEQARDRLDRNSAQRHEHPHTHTIQPEHRLTSVRRIWERLSWR